MKRTVMVVATCLAVSLAFSSPTTADVEGRPCGGEPTDELIQYGDLVTCAVESAGDSDLFRFVGEIGETVTIQVTDDAPGGSGTPCLEVFTPPPGPVTPILCRWPAARRDVTLEQTGEFAVRVSEGFNDGPLSYSIVLERLAPPSPSAVGIDSGELFTDGMIAPVGDLDVFFFNGTAGDTVSLMVTDASPGGVETPCAQIFGPDGLALGIMRCSGPTAVFDETLQQSGAHAVVVGESSNDATLQFHVEYQCVVGNCPAVTRPVCDIAFPQDVYQQGETVASESWRLANPGLDPAAVELKVWLDVPGVAPVQIWNLGADGSLVLPAAFDHDLGAIPLFEVTSAFPAGRYGFHCRVLDPVTGETRMLDLNQFEVTE